MYQVTATVDLLKPSETWPSTASNVCRGSPVWLMNSSMSWTLVSAVPATVAR